MPSSLLTKASGRTSVFGRVFTEGHNIMFELLFISRRPLCMHYWGVLLVHVYECLQAAVIALADGFEFPVTILVEYE